MKKEISQRKREASRQNSILGGEARKRNTQAIYLSNPTYCKQCSAMLPQCKKNYTFCSQSCGAVYNNTGRIKVERYACAYCGIKNLTSGTTCSYTCAAEHRRLYKTPAALADATRKRNREVSANYRAKLKSQTPVDADRPAMRKFYNECPVGYEVDHIVPISKGGLHTLANLQYLTITENRRKSNKL